MIPPLITLAPHCAIALAARRTGKLNGLRCSAGEGRTFTFTPNSSYTPYAPNPQQVYYALDTWQNAWLKATPTGDGLTWTGTTPMLQRGVHILYAWAGDGSEATSINPNRPRTTSRPSSSPIIGQVAAYLFVVGPQQSTFFPLVTR